MLIMGHSTQDRYPRVFVDNIPIAHRPQGYAIDAAAQIEWLLCTFIIPAIDPCP